MGKARCRHCDMRFDSKEALEQHSAVKHTPTGIQGSSVKAGIPMSRVWVISIIVLAVVGFIAYSFYSSTLTGSHVAVPGKYDNFARCLSEKGAAMYGSYLCSHCQSQKKAFGDSWKYVDYVECSPDGAGANPGLCSQQGIRGYPTWMFDGKKLEGEQSLLSLGIWSRCELG